MDDLRKYNDVFQFYNPEDIPQNWICYLLGDDQHEFLLHQWKDFAVNGYGDNNDWQHPMNSIESFRCTVIYCREDHLFLKFMFNETDRYHCVYRVLPLKKLFYSFEVFCIEKNPYLIIDQEFFNEIVNSTNSTYAFIDFVGFKKIFQQNGTIPASIINPILKVTNSLSKENPEMEFLSFADNIVIKASWNIFVGNRDYQPEKFILMLQKLLLNLKVEAGINAYCIVTQGADYIKESEIAFENPQNSNHFFFSSISVPFKDIFEIDEDIRIKVKNGLRKSEFYIEESFYSSLKKKYLTGEEPVAMPKQHVNSQSSDRSISYFALSNEELTQLVLLD